jgi:hypothetical protein
MNTFNRILVVVGLLAALVACSTVLIVPTAVDGLVRQLAVLSQRLGTLRPLVRVGLGVLFALTLDIVLVLLLVLELRRPQPRAIRVERVAGGEVTISVSSIVDRLRYELDLLPGILRVKPKVRARRGGVVVTLDVQAAAPLDVPQNAEHLVETARAVIEERLGLRLARPPRVELRTVEPPRARPTWPAAPHGAQAGTRPAAPSPEKAETPEEPAFALRADQPREEATEPREE